MRVRSYVAASCVLVCCAWGCATEETDSHPSEVVSGPEEDMVLTTIRDGDSLYVAHALRIDRIDVHTGAITTVAGEGWNACPRKTGSSWLSVGLDDDYPRLVLRGTSLYLVGEDCGIWTFDMQTGKSRLLVDPSYEEKQERFDAEGRYPETPTWNGKDGPDWQPYSTTALASDGDGLVACFQVSAHYTEPKTRAHVEMWSIALDGTPRERLAVIESPDDREECHRIIVDPTSTLLSTRYRILRWDRRTRAVTTLAEGFSYGTRGLAEDDTDVYYVGEQNEIVRLPRSGGAPVLLRPPASSQQDFPRFMLTLDGEYVYFQEGYTLKRMRKSGEELFDFAPGNRDDWVLPMTPGITDAHVYFETITHAPDYSSAEPKFLGTLRRGKRDAPTTTMTTENRAVTETLPR